MVDRSLPPDAAATLRALLPTLGNVIGFYDLLYEHEPTPARRMVYEAHFATSALTLAVEVRGLLARLEAEE